MEVEGNNVKPSFFDHEIEVSTSFGFIEAKDPIEAANMFLAELQNGPCLFTVKDVDTGETWTVELNDKDGLI
jgi:hypothetical protein